MTRGGGIVEFGLYGVFTLILRLVNFLYKNTVTNEIFSKDELQNILLTCVWTKEQTILMKENSKSFAR